MTDITALTAPTRQLWRRTDKALVATVLILALSAAIWPTDLPETLGLTLSSFLHTAPFILFAVAAVAGLKATGAERLVSRAFTGPTARMIVMGALLGGLSPFCSCEVIPFVAALLAMGVPLAGVMAFWLSSPLMDPAMFSITAATLGWEFALAKTVAAVGTGLLGGTVVWALGGTAMTKDILRPRASGGCGCGAGAAFQGAPVWAFWREPARRDTFRAVAGEQAFFLGKWLLLAYTIEALMILHLPAAWIAQALGGDGMGPILLGAVVGAPAYLNGYAAASLLGALVEQGMATGAAMAFMIAGGVSSVPAAVAVAALVKTRVLMLYLGLGVTAAVMAGTLWSLLA